MWCILKLTPAIRDPGHTQSMPMLEVKQSQTYDESGAMQHFMNHDVHTTPPPPIKWREKSYGDLYVTWTFFFF